MRIIRTLNLMSALGALLLFYAQAVHANSAVDAPSSALLPPQQSPALLTPIAAQESPPREAVLRHFKRSDLEAFVMPAVWRSTGVGRVGQIGPALRYEVYVTAGPDATLMGEWAARYASVPLYSVGGRSWLLVGRVEAEPRDGATVGASILAGDLGDESRFYGADGQRLGLHLPLYGGEVDGRWCGTGIEARTMVAVFAFPRAGDLMAAHEALGAMLMDTLLRGATPTAWGGALVEIAYDVLDELPNTTQQLLPFVRLEYYDTQAAMPDGFTANPARAAWVTSTGLSYRPSSQLVMRGDGQYRVHGDGSRDVSLDVGVGYAF